MAKATINPAVTKVVSPETVVLEMSKQEAEQVKAILGYCVGLNAQYDALHSVLPGLGSYTLKHSKGYGNDAREDVASLYLESVASNW